MKSRQVPFFLYWPVENVQFCIHFIGHLGLLSGISNFPRLHKNVKSLELWKYISENTSPKGSFWRNKIKSEFSNLSSDSSYLQAVALKPLGSCSGVLTVFVVHTERNETTTTAERTHKQKPTARDARQFGLHERSHVSAIFQSLNYRCKFR